MNIFENLSKIRSSQKLLVFGAPKNRRFFDGIFGALEHGMFGACENHRFSRLQNWKFCKHRNRRFRMHKHFVFVSYDFLNSKIENFDSFYRLKKISSRFSEHSKNFIKFFESWRKFILNFLNPKILSTKFWGFKASKYIFSDQLI